MRLFSRSVVAFACWVAGASGCAPLANVDEVPEGACSSEARLCGDSCASMDDPAYGCGDPSCSPCDFPDANADTGYGNALFTCGPPAEGPSLNRCKLATCLDGFTGTRCQCFRGEPCEESVR